MLTVPKVKPSIVKMLIEDGWTPEKLAKAHADDLTGYTGIGDVTAWRIIVAARRHVRDATPPVVVDRSKLIHISPTPPAVYKSTSHPSPPPSPPPPPAKMSERVRRIQESLQ